MLSLCASQLAETYQQHACRIQAVYGQQILFCTMVNMHIRTAIKDEDMSAIEREKLWIRMEKYVPSMH